jgi:hypothetical protein
VPSERTRPSPLVWCGAAGSSECASQRSVELAPGKPLAANEDLGDVVDLLPALVNELARRLTTGGHDGGDVLVVAATAGELYRDRSLASSVVLGSEVCVRPTAGLNGSPTRRPPDEHVCEVDTGDEPVNVLDQLSGVATKIEGTGSFARWFATT